MNYDVNKEEWNNEWAKAENIEASASIIGKWLRTQRLNHVKDILDDFDLGCSIIDMGCGAGTTLKLLRDLGFANSIGIDFSVEAIKRCKTLGFVENKDVFNVDASNTLYSDNEFDLVFEEGLWEHFVNPNPFVIEAARIAKKWILVIQPNHYTPFGCLLHWGWKLFRGGGVLEHSFRFSYFRKILDNCGFDLVDRRRDIFRAQDVALFRSREILQ